MKIKALLSQLSRAGWGYNLLNVQRPNMSVPLYNSPFSKRIRRAFVNTFSTVDFWSNVNVLSRFLF